MENFLTWKKEYEIHVATIDEQHKRFTSLINSIHDAIHEGKGAEIVKKTFADLEAYAIEHFSHEEELLFENNYPELAQQKEEHRKFIREVSEYEMVSNPELSLRRLFDYLVKWWISHLAGEDQKIGPFLNKLGIY